MAFWILKRLLPFRDNGPHRAGPIHDSPFVLRAFSALHEGCLTLPLWVEMTYNNCKFPCNLNNVSRPFHCLLFGKCQKWIRGPVPPPVFTRSADTRLPTTFLDVNLELFRLKCNHSGSTRRQHGVWRQQEKNNNLFQMQIVTYCCVLFCGRNLSTEYIRLISEN